jgi:hypothetical protein
MKHRFGFPVLPLEEGAYQPYHQDDEDDDYEDAFQAHGVLLFMLSGACAAKAGTQIVDVGVLWDFVVQVFEDFVVVGDTLTVKVDRPEILVELFQISDSFDMGGTGVQDDFEGPHSRGHLSTRWAKSEIEVRIRSVSATQAARSFAKSSIANGLNLAAKVSGSRVSK